MNKTAWDRLADSTFELWDHFIWLLAQRLCQSRGIGSQGESDHIRNPAKDNHPCEPCYFELADLADPDLCEAIGILGSAAYMLGHERIAESEASVRTHDSWPAAPSTWNVLPTPGSRNSPDTFGWNW